MSFYGSIYYQLVDAFNRLWFSNQGKDSVIFPGEDKLVNPNPPEGVPEDTFEYHSPGRQGVIDLKSGNRWIAFTQNEEDNSFKIWHREADTESAVPGNGFCHVPNTYFIIQQEGEKREELIARCIKETSEKIAEEGGTFTLEENCRIVAEIPSEADDVDPSYVIYKYVDGEWTQELEATQDAVTILKPDDFFVTTESYTVDGAGHMTPGARHLYKMPKSDVQEEIDALKLRMTKNEEHDDEQDDDIESLEKYVGDWSHYRGGINDKAFNYWVPGISDAIGDMCELIAGHKNTFNDDGTPKDIWYDWERNRDVTIARVIGNLTELRDDLKANDNAYFSIDDETKLSDISIIDVIRYLKNTLIANNTTTLTGHTGQLINLTDDINRLTADTSVLSNRADALETRADAIEADIEEINDPQTGILITAKNYTDSLANGAVKTNTESIAAINHPETGILANAKSYTDNLANGAVKDNTNAIAAINNSETGILANAKKYTDTLATGAVKNNTDAITAINDSETGILKTANNYTDTKIGELDYTDNDAAEEQYVYSVNEVNGIITVVHKPLPTLTTGSTNGTVALSNGSEAFVKGLGSAAYANTGDFDSNGAAATAQTEAIKAAKAETEAQIEALKEGAIATAKSEAISAAKTETENQIKELADGAVASNTTGVAEAKAQVQELANGAVASNTTAITDLQNLLKDYDQLVAKVAKLEERIAALESASSNPEPDPTPDPGGSSETTT